MSRFQHIDTQTAKARLDEDSALFLDIRDEMSFHSGHIRGSQHMDNHRIPDFLTETEKSQPLIVCCYHGNSSQPAAQFFVSQGFAEVYSLDGGYDLWRQHYPDDCSSGFENE